MKQKSSSVSLECDPKISEILNLFSTTHIYSVPHSGLGGGDVRVEEECHYHEEQSESESKRLMRVACMTGTEELA